MTKEYELSAYDRHELNYHQISWGCLPMLVFDDYTIRTILDVKFVCKMIKNNNLYVILGTITFFLNFLVLKI